MAQVFASSEFTWVRLTDDSRGRCNVSHGNGRSLEYGSGQSPGPDSAPGVRHHLRLVERFCEGDPAAVTLLWTEHGVEFARRLQRRYSRLLSFDRCEFLILDAFARAWQSRASFAPAKGRFEAWLWRIALRRAAYELRKPWFQECCRERSLSTESLFLVVDPLSHDPVDSDEGETEPALSLLVERAMQALSPQEYAVLAADMESPGRAAPSKELSRRLGLAESTVRWHRSRGRAKLRAEMLRLGFRPRGEG